MNEGWSAVNFLHRSRGSSAPEFIAKICDAFIEELKKRDIAKYVNSILTAHVVKTPPDHEAGLGLLLRLRGNVLLYWRGWLS